MKSCLSITFNPVAGRCVVRKKGDCIWEVCIEFGPIFLQFRFLIVKNSSGGGPGGG